MTITTSRGMTLEVNWAFPPRGTDKLMIELPDTRPVADIATEFDGLSVIERKSDTEGDATYTGYTMLTGVVKNTKQGTALLTLEKAVDADGHGD